MDVRTPNSPPSPKALLTAQLLALSGFSPMSINGGQKECAKNGWQILTWTMVLRGKLFPEMVFYGHMLPPHLQYSIDHWGRVLFW